MNVLEEVPADQITGNHEEYIDAYESAGERVRKCMIEENRYDRERAQSLYVSPNHVAVDGTANFLQVAIRSIETTVGAQCCTCVICYGLKLSSKNRHRRRMPTPSKRRSRQFFCFSLIVTAQNFTIQCVPL